MILERSDSPVTAKDEVTTEESQLAVDERREEGRDLCVEMVREMVNSRALPPGYAERALDALQLVEHGEPRR